MMRPDPAASRCVRRGRLSCAMLLLALLVLTGCPPRDDGLIIDPPPQPPPEVMPTYSQLAAAQSARLASLERVWARAKVHLRWVEEDKRRSERGEARLLLKLDEPGLGLSIGSAFGDMMWAGYDAERFWLFDLENDKAWVGEAGSGRVLLISGMPLPLDPDLTPLLLGFAPLDPGPVPPKVTWDHGMFRVDRPERNTRQWFYRDSLLPAKVELIDSEGRALVTCVLSDYGPFRGERAVAAGKPQVRVPQTVGVAVERRDVGITLMLSGFSESKRRFKDRAFEFESLVEIHEPNEVVNLAEP